MVLDEFVCNLVLLFDFGYVWEKFDLFWVEYWYSKVMLILGFGEVFGELFIDYIYIIKRLVSEMFVLECVFD